MSEWAVALPASGDCFHADGANFWLVLGSVAPLADTFKVFGPIVEKVSVFVMDLRAARLAAAFTGAVGVVTSSVVRGCLTCGEWLCGVTRLKKASGGDSDTSAGYSTANHGFEAPTATRARLGVMGILVGRAERLVTDETELGHARQYTMTLASQGGYTDKVREILGNHRMETR